MQALNKHQALAFVSERRALFDAAGSTNPFACSAWTLHFIEQIVAGDWQILAAEGAGGASLALLHRDPARPHHCSALTNYYASLWSPLVGAPRDRAAALDDIVADLTALRPAPATLGFAPLDAAAPDTAALATALSRRGWYARRYFCFGNWYQPCAGMGFEDYMRARDSQLLNTWKRKSRRFASGADGARLEIVTEPGAVDAGLAAYQAVYARSWKVAEPYPEFVPGWARICAENGWLRLGLAWIGAVPVAAQFWFTLHGRAFIFKLAYDEQYAKYSAGTVLTAHMIRHSLEQDRVTEIDYLTGDDAYKRSWMSMRRERVGLIACNTRTARGLASAARELAGALTQRWRSPAAPA